MLSSILTFLSLALLQMKTLLASSQKTTLKGKTSYLFMTLGFIKRLVRYHEDVVMNLTIHPRTPFTHRSTSFSDLVMNLHLELKQHILLLEHGINMVMT